MIKKKGGIVFWLTGLPGSGKTAISSHLINNIRKKYGPTILISGDDIRKIFHLHGYKKLDRLKIGKKYFEFCRFFSDQGFNILINVVCLFKNIRKLNRSKLENYTDKDPLMKKGNFIKNNVTFTDHYRRFINLKKLIFLLKKDKKIKILYVIEKKGLSRYRSDNPVLARLILRLN